MAAERRLLEEYAAVKIMEWFSQHPSISVYVNELADEIGLSNASCSRILNLLKENGVLERKEMGRAHYYSLMDNFFTREMKRFFTIMRLHESTLVQDLVEEDPSLTNLVLYGSCATGENDEQSDLDILAITNGTINTDLDRFQMILKRKIEITSINIGRWVSMKRSDDGFYKEIKDYGIPLYGGNLP